VIGDQEKRLREGEAVDLVNSQQWLGAIQKTYTTLEQSRIFSTKIIPALLKAQLLWVVFPTAAVSGHWEWSAIFNFLIKQDYLFLVIRDFNAIIKPDTATILIPKRLVLSGMLLKSNQPSNNAQISCR
jgi:hypothetical protein